MKSLLCLSFCILVLAGFGCTAESPTGASDAPQSAEQRLAAAQTWMYQIQELDREGAIEALAASTYPLFVLDPTRTNRGTESFDTRKMIQQLRKAPDGQARIILAYIDIGEAEDYRTYWQPNWRAPAAGQPGEPDFLLTFDPDGWSGNYPVAYWEPRWQQIWLGPSGLVAGLTQDGFDGVYLDWVEAYDDSIVREAAANQGIDPEEAMMSFIEKIRQTGRSVREDFLVVPQNAPYLIDHDPMRYAGLIDGLAVEDTWFSGTGDAEWDDPASGDIPNENSDEYSTNNLLNQYKEYLQRGLPVFSVDYCLNPANAQRVYREAREAGLRPLVTRVALSRITGTPP